MSFVKQLQNVSGFINLNFYYAVIYTVYYCNTLSGIKSPYSEYLQTDYFSEPTVVCSYVSESRHLGWNSLRDADYMNGTSQM
uniref:Uncharacterized protein n=1 Tax=Anguilla anguilla TaxID=7936 RepID=A0A0E9XKB3_ANGAN